MPDDLTDSGPRDRERINIHEPHEVVYWCRAFGCTKEELINAVARVGVMAEAVRRFLGK